MLVARPGHADRRPAARRRPARGPGLDHRAARPPGQRNWPATGDLQLTLFDTQDLAEITSPDFPGERLVACMNPFLEAERGPQAGIGFSRPLRPTWRRSPSPARGPGGRCAASDKIGPARGQGAQPAQGSPSTSPSLSPTTASATPATQRLHHPRGRPGRHLPCCGPAVDPGSLDSGEVVYLVQGPSPRSSGAFRAFNTDLDIRPIRHRTEHRVRPTCSCGIAVVLHQLARAGPARAHLVHRRRQARRPGRPFGQSPRRPRRPLPEGAGQGRSPSTPMTISRCTEHGQPARRPGHHLPQSPSSPPTPACPASGWSPPLPRSSGAPWTCSASATASASRSQQPVPHLTKAQVNDPARGSAGGTSA